MLLADIGAVDYAVLACYLLMVMAIGVYFSRQQHSSQDFFLAGRSMGWFPVGLSVMATLLSALSYTGVPSESYKVGLNLALYGFSIWLTLPLMLLIVVPLYRRLDIFSVYEYLEMRYSLAVRMAASVVFVVWRLLWLGGVLYAPCKVVTAGMGLDAYLYPLLITLGVVGTAYTFLGGMKAVIWTDVIQTAVMVTGLLLIIGAVWMNVEGGSAGVWRAAQQFGRDTAVPVSWEAGTSFWSQKWLLWSMVPHMFFAYLSFYIADQITAQRFLTTKSAAESGRSFVLNCFSVTLMMGALMYVGIALLAYYNQHPEQLQPYWIANVKTGQDSQILADPQTGEPYLKPDMEFSQRLERLIAAGVLLDPNTSKPITDKSQAIDPETGEVNIQRLARRHPTSGEFLLQRGHDRIMPHFIASVLPSGLAGLLFAALLAASMSSLDSGLNSITTLAIRDFYDRLGLMQRPLAALRGKSVDQLDATDEMWLARWLVLAMGVAATAFALFVSQLESIFTIMISVCNTFGAPLLAVFLLGFFTRRTTAAAALTALAAGMPFTVWLAFGYDWGMWPSDTQLDSTWAVTFGVLGTMLFGYLLSFCIGRPKTEIELTGLVAGCGQLGLRPEMLEEAIDEGDPRWAEPQDDDTESAG